MANTVTTSGKYINIVCDGSTDWSYSSLKPSTGFRLASIEFYPSQANDIIAIRSGSATGPYITKRKDTTGGGVRIPIDPSGISQPVLHPADCTINNWANALIILEMVR